MLLLSAALLLAGCAGSLKGAPDRVFSIEEEAGLARSLAGEPVYALYFQASDDATRRRLRQQIVFAKMYGIDVQYSEYEAKLTRERQEEGFLGTITTLGLTSAATTVGGAEAKTLLAAAATAVTGAGEAYSKDILLDRTVAVLQEQMRAQRKAVRASIVARLSLPVATYPLELALGDVDAYYRAGTITGALIGASQQSSLLLTAANDVESRVISSPLQQDAASARILAFTRASTANQDAVRAWLDSQGFDVPITFFATSARYAAERVRLADEIPRLGARRIAPPPRVIPGPTSRRPVRPSDVGHAVVPPIGSPAAAIERFARRGGKQAIDAWGRRQTPPVTFLDLLSPDHLDEQRRIVEELHIR